MLFKRGFLTWGLIELSPPIEDQHGMDTAFHNKHKIQSFPAIVNNVGVRWDPCCLWVGFFVRFLNMAKGLYFHKPGEAGCHSHQVKAIFYAAG